MTSLAEHLNAEFDSEYRTDSDAFVVDTEKKCTWALRKLAESRMMSKAKHQEAADQIAKVQDWLAHEIEPVERSSHYFESLLRDYALRNRTERVKSWTFTEGRIQTRTRKPSIDIIDETLAIEWAKANQPDAVKVKESLLKSALTADLSGDTVVSPDGEPIPGLTTKPGGVSVEVSTHA